jgi:hypothetical protein
MDRYQVLIASNAYLDSTLKLLHRVEGPVMLILAALMIAFGVFETRRALAHMSPEAATRAVYALTLCLCCVPTVFYTAHFIFFAAARYTT